MAAIDDSGCSLGGMDAAVSKFSHWDAMVVVQRPWNLVVYAGNGSLRSKGRWEKLTKQTPMDVKCSRNVAQSGVSMCGKLSYRGYIGVNVNFS